MEKLYPVYDFVNRSPWSPIMILPPIFMVLGVCIFYISKRFGDDPGTIFFMPNKRRYNMIFGLIFAIFASLMSILVIPQLWIEYLAEKKIYDNKEYIIVEGRVDNFHPMPAAGHDHEKFDVNGIHFEFSDFELGDYGYNNAASKGGAIKENLKVRIAYFSKGIKNVILKLYVE